MSIEAASPRPWVTRHTEDNNWEVQAADGYFTAVTCSGLPSAHTEAANAALIVSAVNGYEALRAALQDIANQAGAPVSDRAGMIARAELIEKAALKVLAPPCTIPHQHVSSSCNGVHS